MRLINITQIYKLRMAAVLCLLFLVLIGCASHDKKTDTVDQFNKWRILSESSQPVTPVPVKKQIEDRSATENKIPDPAAQSVDKPTHPLVDENKPLPEMLVSMRMHNVSVPVLLKTLSRIADVNIMINESISGHVNIDVKNIPWDTAFLSLLETYGLTYEWSGVILRVITVEDLNKKKALLEAKQEFEQIKKEHSITMLQIKKKQEQYEPLLTKIVKIHYADLHALQSNLKTYLMTEVKDRGMNLSGAERKAIPTGQMHGTIMIDELTSSLIIQASQSDINKIMPIINQLDQPIKQVRIEAHIVEANSDVAKELGIQWGGLGRDSSGNRNTWIGGSLQTNDTPLIVNSDENIIDSSTGTGIGLPSIENTSATDLTGMTIGLVQQKIGDYLLYAQLNALEEQGELNILSKPSITTMDHRKAIIKSGKEVPYQTVTNDGDIEVQFKEAVIKLEVIPHIINKKIVRLEIVTHKDELDWTNTVNGNPTIITKNAETQVTLFDGQTTVIAGLNKELLTKGEAGVPGLKDVPGLGWLFKTQNKSNDMEELLIFITPYVLEEKTHSND